MAFRYPFIRFFPIESCSGPVSRAILLAPPWMRCCTILKAASASSATTLETSSSFAVRSNNTKGTPISWICLICSYEVVALEIDRMIPSQRLARNISMFFFSFSKVSLEEATSTLYPYLSATSSIFLTTVAKKVFTIWGTTTPIVLLLWVFKATAMGLGL